jgi:uncharacterized membrane protein HdeD (DUF308 family)
MGTIATGPFNLELVGFESLSVKWERLMIAGIAMTILGAVSILLAGFTTLATTMVLGGFVAAGGIAQIAHAFSSRGWSGIFLNLLIGILYTVAGGMMIVQPLTSALTITLFLGILFLATGFMRAITAVLTRYPSWGWMLTSGIVTIILGALVLRGYPETGLWVLGTFVGVDLLMGGAALIGLSLAAHRVAT